MCMCRHNDDKPAASTRHYPERWVLTPMSLSASLKGPVERPSDRRPVSLHCMHSCKTSWSSSHCLSNVPNPLPTRS
eukprot:XP_001697215.1 predicted protein [Chlamydomonas reinhardtii]